MAVQPKPPLPSTSRMSRLQFQCDGDLDDNAVAEGAGNGTFVGITASSTDPKGPDVVYSLTDNAGGRFAIHSASGEVSVADSTLLDFETSTSHSITVQATDGTDPVTKDLYDRSAERGAKRSGR